MLLFVDKPKNIRVLRALSGPDGVSKREQLGVIAKGTFEIPTELQGSLSAEEKTEMSETLDLYRQAMLAEQRSVVLNLPRTLREAMTYIESPEATDAEKRLVVTSILETVRLIRKSQRAV